jgi:hypothetical protein
MKAGDSNGLASAPARSARTRKGSQRILRRNHSGWSSQRARDCIRLALDDLQQHTRGALRHCSALFPLLSGAQTEAEAFGKFVLREACFLADAAHVRPRDNETPGSLVSVETFGTNKIDESLIADLVRVHFDLRPAAIIHNLNLRRPIYLQTAAYGHFGRVDLDCTAHRLATGV